MASPEFYVLPHTYEALSVRTACANVRVAKKAVRIAVENLILDAGVDRSLAAAGLRFAAENWAGAHGTLPKLNGFDPIRVIKLS